MKKFLANGWLVLGSSILLGMLFWSLSFYAKDIKTYKQVVSVTGTATKNVESDLAKWHISLARKSLDRGENMSSVIADESAVREYLTKNGFSESEISSSSIDVTPIFKQNPNGYGPTDEVANYETRSTFVITTKKVSTVSTMRSELRRMAEVQGIEISSEFAEYSYSQFDKEKIPLLKKAIIDAQERAQALVSATVGVSRTSIGRIVNAQQGVFQVNAANDNSVSDYGNFDTTSILKTIRATVSVEFMAN